MFIALASGAAAGGNGLWVMRHGALYPDAWGQILLIFGFSILFTFMGSFWFGLAFKQRPMRVWMAGALKASVAWMATITFAFLIPIWLYGVGAKALTGAQLGGMVVTPFIAESISGSLTFGLCLAAIVAVVAFFHTKGADWFLSYK